jgi:signal transduction histidine kinase
MEIRKTVCLSLLLLISILSHGQITATDSFRRLLAQTHSDTGRILLQIRLANTYNFYQPDSAMMLIQNILQEVRRLQFAKGEGRALNVLGLVLTQQAELPRALENYFHALQISRSVHDRQGEAGSLTYIGGIYVQLSQYRQGIFYLQQALKIAERPQNIDFLATSNIGDAYEKMNLLDSALFFQQQAISMVKAMPRGGTTMLSLALTRLGHIQARLKNNTSAFQHYRQALRNAYVTGDLLNLGRIQYRIAELYHQLHQADSSLHYAQLAFFTSQRRSKITQLDASNLLAKLYDEHKQPDSAFYYQRVAMVVTDSLYGPEKFQRLQLLTLAEQQRQQELLQEQARSHERFQRIGLLSALGVFLVIALLLWRNIRQQRRANTELNQKNSQIETQRNTLETTLSELRTTQSQLIQSEKMASLGELTAGIAHEIQNPLNFVNNFSEVNSELIDEMQQELKGGGNNEAFAISNDIKANLDKINQHGKRADAIVKSMLEHSRTSSGTKEPVDINKLVDEYVHLAYHGLRAKDKLFRVTLKTDYDENIGEINIVPQDIGRVVLNLISNAFYAVNERAKEVIAGYEPTVSVSTKKQKGNIEIKIKDNGNGIPQKILKKIFQPFFTTKPTGQGTGLGLSLAYDIIKAHVGEIKVETREMEFTEFIAELPLTKI